MKKCARSDGLHRGEAYDRGFSLIELIVALTVFLVVSAVSFTLFGRHQALLSQEQVTVGLNIGLRNALSQLQLDMVNAGDGLILGANVPAWPVGVTIKNSDATTATCNPTAVFPPVYAAACFDKFSIIIVDPNTPALHPCVITSCTVDTSASTTLTGQFSPSYAASTYAGNFKSGDQVLFVQSCAGGGHASNTSGCKYTTAILTSVGTSTTTGTNCSTGCVNLNFNSTAANGTNTTGNDPLGMTTSSSAAPQLTAQFNQNDWVVRLLPITYWVDATNAADPQLKRTQATASNVLMDQVIGFKVGAALWNNSNTQRFLYDYDDVNDYADAFNLIRSVRVSIIGRTAPDPSNPFRNLFDLGPYQIRGSSVIINPRNLTMNSD